MINIANHRPANFWKSKCLMAQLETTTWPYLRCPVAFFATHGKDFFYDFFFNIQKKIVRSGA